MKSILPSGRAQDFIPRVNQALMMNCRGTAQTRSPRGNHLGEFAPFGCGQVSKEKVQVGPFIASPQKRWGQGVGWGGAGAGQDVGDVTAVILINYDIDRALTICQALF